MPLKIQFPRPSLFSKQRSDTLLFTQHWYWVFLRQMCQKTKLIVRLFSSSHPSRLIPDRIYHIPSVKCCHGLYTHAIQPFILFALKTRCHSTATYYWRSCLCVTSHLLRGCDQEKLLGHITTSHIALYHGPLNQSMTSIWNTLIKELWYNMYIRCLKTNDSGVAYIARCVKFTRETRDTKTDVILFYDVFLRTWARWFHFRSLFVL